MQLNMVVYLLESHLYSTCACVCLYTVDGHSARVLKDDDDGDESCMHALLLFLVQSDTASLSIPELEFDMQPGTLGGRFTTMEGLLVDIKEQLSTSNPFVTGDSTSMNKLKQFVQKLDDVRVPVDIHVVDLYGHD